MKIRKTKIHELEILIKLYDHARAFMTEHGNPNQWGGTYPERGTVERDIRSGHSYVCENQSEIVAAFYFLEGEDGTYREIHGGQWLDDDPYGVVHRIASEGTTKGAASFCLDWALQQCGNVRIDTHRDNLVMQNLLKKNGFLYCGIIYVEDGTERLAYQKKSAVL